MAQILRCKTTSSSLSLVPLKRGDVPKKKPVMRRKEKRTIRKRRRIMNEQAKANENHYKVSLH